MRGREVHCLVQPTRGGGFGGKEIGAGQKDLLVNRRMVQVGMGELGLGKYPANAYSGTVQGRPVQTYWLGLSLHYYRKGAHESASG